MGKKKRWGFSLFHKKDKNEDFEKDYGENVMKEQKDGKKRKRKESEEKENKESKEKKDKK